MSSTRTPDGQPAKRRTAMKPNPEALPGLEVDSKGEPLPYAERLREDQEKVDALIEKAATIAERRK